MTIPRYFLYPIPILLTAFLLTGDTFAQNNQEEGVAIEQFIGTTTTSTPTTTSSLENTANSTSTASSTASSTSQIAPSEERAGAARSLPIKHSETTLDEAKQKRIINLAANMSNRIDAVIVRFDKIVTRLESRVNKQKLEGIDTGNSEEELAKAKVTLEVAKQSIRDIDTLVYNATLSTTAPEDWILVKETFRSTKELLVQNKAELRTVITAIKNSTPITETTIETSIENASNTLSSDAEIIVEN